MKKKKNLYYWQTELALMVGHVRSYYFNTISIFLIYIYIYLLNKICLFNEYVQKIITKSVSEWKLDGKNDKINLWCSRKY